MMQIVNYINHHVFFIFLSKMHQDNNIKNTGLPIIYMAYRMSVMNADWMSL